MSESSSEPASSTEAQAQERLYTADEVRALMQNLVRILDGPFAPRNCHRAAVIADQIEVMLTGARRG